jgi:hypothetical protein
MDAARTPRRRSGACALLALGWGLGAGGVQAAVSDPAFGGSPIPVGAGPRALGMGGAFSAVADDASASTWNPAGMVQLERPELALSAGWYWRRVERGDATDDRRDDLDLDHASAQLPFHAFGCQQTIGLAWQRQFDFGRTVAVAAHVDDGMGAITDQVVAIDQDGALASWGLSYAIEVAPGLAFGATLHAWGDALTGRSRYRKDVHERDDITVSFPFVITSVLTVDEHREAVVEEGYSAVLGTWWQALPALTVALVVKPAYALRIATERETTVTSDGIAAPTQHEHLAARFHYPTSATLGLAWRQGDRDTIACDATWTQWSHYRLVEDGRTSSPVNSFIPPGDFADGISLRLGYEHLALFDELVAAVRIGALYEELPGAAPSPDANQPASTHATVDRYYGLTAGTSLCFDHLLYDLAAQVRQGRKVGTGQDAAPDQTADITTVIVRVGVAYQF